MIIEVSGTGFRNMGAELMLAAIRDELGSWGIVDDVAISLRTGSSTQRANASVGSVARLDLPQFPLLDWVFDLGTRVVPAALLGRTRTYKPSGIEALLDASGFLFGDQLGAAAARKKAHLFRSYARRGKPVILLPQAFGPFERREVADAARLALEAASLIFARDPGSLRHLANLGLPRPLVVLAPDFTNLVRPEPETLPDKTVVVVPNVRMTEMVDTAAAAAYAGFLRTCTSTALEHHYRVVLLAHETKDREFAVELVAEFGERVSVRAASDPRRTKAFVGGAELVISSRYHGLVNALSQCVPAIGTSWSHKYPELFAEYGCADALWEVADPASTSERLASWLRPAFLEMRRAELKGPAASVAEGTHRMWSQVRSMLAG